MTTELKNIYGNPLQDEWAYRIVDANTGETVLEGRAERTSEGFSLSVGPTGKVEGLEGFISNPLQANDSLISILDARADKVAS